MTHVLSSRRAATTAVFPLIVFVVLTAATSSQAQLVVNPSSAAFGSVSVGSSKTVSETFSNTGRYKLGISQVAVSGPGFAVTNCSVPMTLWSGQSKRCSVVFSPTTAGSVTGSLTIYWRGGEKNHQTAVTLAGTGVSSTGQLQASPAGLNFGTQQTGSTAALMETIVNSGSAAVTISQVAVSGTGFTFSGINPPVTLASGQSVTFNVAFAPQTGGSASGSLSVSSNASNSMLGIPLSGSGSAPGQLTASPSTASFGNVVVGMQQSQTASLSAVGGPVTVSSIGLNGSQFSLSGITLPLSLAAGQSAPYTVTFAPQVTGTASGSFTFITNASVSTTQSASGTGIPVPQHSVTLNWAPSTSGSIAGYNVYRGSQSGGPFNIITAALDASTTYVDSTVQGGQTYFYVVTAVDSAGLQSSYSNQVQAVIPYP